jgi:hypothetical protein
LRAHLRCQTFFLALFFHFRLFSGPALLPRLTPPTPTAVVAL